ncbi:TonB-linked outer membrane protein, partial [Striga asiatica]
TYNIVVHNHILGGGGSSYGRSGGGESVRPAPQGSGLGNADSNKGNNDKISDDGVLIVRSVGLEVPDRLAENNYVGEEIREEGEKDHLGEEHDDSQLMDIDVQAAPLGDKRGQKKKKTFVRKTRASVKGGNRVNVGIEGKEGGIRLGGVEGNKRNIEVRGSDEIGGSSNMRMAMVAWIQSLSEDMEQLSSDARAFKQLWCSFRFCDFIFD